MQTSFVSRALLALLPATLLFAACGKKDTPTPTPAPDQGRILVSHAAASSNTQITAFANDQQIAQLNYGQTNGSYASVNVGTPTVRINNGSQQVATQSLTLAKDQSYSVFAYSPTASIGNVSLLTVADNLTAPPAGQIKIRLVNLGVGAASPLRLTVPSPLPSTPGTNVTTDVALAAASDFVNLTAGPLTLNVTTSNTLTPFQSLNVGDGSGSGSGSKTYEAGKIYTVVVRGIAGNGVPAAQQLQAVLIQNN